MRWLMAATLLLVAGCAEEAPPASHPAVDDDSAPTSTLPQAGDLRGVADAAAKVWDPAAKLILVAAFQGDLAHDPGNPWVEPYRNAARADLPEGRSPLWSFSYGLDDPITAVAQTSCEAGAHAELRLGHIVTVDAAGMVVAEYDTRNDDQGAPPTGFLSAIAVDSAAAADAAWPHYGNDMLAASRIRLFLMGEWYWPGPTWAFHLDFADGSGLLFGVDASDGRVVSPARGPPC